QLPRMIRSPLYGALARAVGARVDEAELPLDEYPSLGAFFARRLREGVRPIASEPDAVVVPCDGVVAISGSADDGQMIQAKGLNYSLRQLLVDERRADHLQGGTYITFYLSYRDYHRVHSPVSGHLLGYDYIPGTFLPVNPLFSRSVDRLMTRNERVVFHLDTSGGAVALVMVGALGVSNIEIAHEPNQNFNETRYLRSNRGPSRVRFDHPIEIAQGDELGAFNLGSTTIVVFQPGAIELQPLDAGVPTRVGERLGRVRNRADRV
ncbi:MAG: archaetidylserine decarboxylase, partial [Myxococcota bacterium]